jgi:hypothetical protein
MYFGGTAFTLIVYRRSRTIPLPFLLHTHESLQFYHLCFTNDIFPDIRMTLVNLSVDDEMLIFVHIVEGNLDKW